MTVELDVDREEIARPEMEEFGERKNRGAKPAAHELHFYPGRQDSRDRVGASRCDVRDVLARKYIDSVAIRTHECETRAIHVLEGDLASHRAIGQRRYFLRDDRSTAFRQPIDSLDPRHRRIDVENHAGKRRRAHE